MVARGKHAMHGSKEEESNTQHNNQPIRIGNGKGSEGEASGGRSKEEQQ